MAQETIRVEVLGLRELGKKLRALGDIKKIKAIARRSLNAGAAPMKKAVKVKAPVAPAPYRVDDGTKMGQLVQPGNIAKQVVTKNVPNPPDMTYAVVIAIRGKRKHGYANRIASLQHFGTVKQSPNPFMQQAYDQTRQESQNIIIDRLRTEIDAAAAAGAGGTT